MRVLRGDYSTKRTPYHMPLAAAYAYPPASRTALDEMYDLRLCVRACVLERAEIDQHNTMYVPGHANIALFGGAFNLPTRKQSIQHACVHMYLFRLCASAREVL